MGPDGHRLAHNFIGQLFLLLMNLSTLLLSSQYTNMHKKGNLTPVETKLSLVVSGPNEYEHDFCHRIHKYTNMQNC